jgi:membrane protein YqaA with SNARE-associated domain
MNKEGAVMSDAIAAAVALVVGGLAGYGIGHSSGDSDKKSNATNAQQKVCDGF